MGRKKTAELPQNFNRLKIKGSARVKTFVTEDEVEEMFRLRALGMSYQKIADALGRAKITVLYHLKDREWVDKFLATSRERGRIWYSNNKDWKHNYYEHRKELCKQGLLEEADV